MIMDGRAVDSCLVMGYQADGSEIWTIEGLPQMWEMQTARKLHPVSRDDHEPLPLHPLQRTFVECGSSQCGICIPGMIMSSVAFLKENPNPTREEIRYGLGGNLCRCTGYVKIFDAVEKAASEMRAFAQNPSQHAPAHQRRVNKATPRRRDGFVASTLKEALKILAIPDSPTRPQLAGGTDSLVRAKDGIGQPSRMVDISRIKELSGIKKIRARGKRTSGSAYPQEIRIGAGTTFTEVLESELLQKYAPALIEACAVIGGPQIRNRGTLGGNFANASPAADSVTALMSMGAILEIASLKSCRQVPAEKFFLGPGKTVLKKNELLVAVRIPKIPNLVGCYLRLGQRRAQAISKVDVAVSAVLKPRGNGSSKNGGSLFDFLGICYGSVAPTIFRARATEAVLKEQSPNPATLKHAKETIKKEVQPIDDIRSTAEYRREMSAVLLERALRRIGALA